MQDEPKLGIQAKSTQVESEMAILINLLDELHLKIDHLYPQLEKVLVTPSTPTSSPEPEKNHELVPLASSIRDMSTKVAMIIDSVEDIVHRLEL